MQSQMEWHPAACIFPMLPHDELQQLADDIREHGQRDPVIIFDGKVLDGRNRWQACKLVGVEPKTIQFKGTESEAVEHVRSTNLFRRHLNETQRGLVGAKLREYYDEAAKQRMKAGKKPDPVENLPQGKSRDEAGKAVGVSGKQVDKATKLINSGREDLIEKCERGEMSLHQATTEIKRDEKRKQLEEKAQAVQREPASDDQPSWLLINDDVTLGLQSVRDHHQPARLIFADPPYNIGVNYGDHHDDSLNDDEFAGWCLDWIGLCNECLADDGSLWVMINDEYVADIAVSMRDCGLHMRAWIKWYESFGVNCSNNFNRTSRHILYFVRDPKRFVFNETAVLRPSDRQLKYGDKRAQSGGKIMDDVWQIPRLTGTSNERIPDVPTQLPLELVSRIVEVASEPGDLVVDPFNGSGTTGVAAVQSHRKYIGIDVSEKFIDIADKRLRGAM